MKKLIIAVALSALSISAFAKDIGPDEAVKLRDSKVVLDYQKLNELALQKHPGATIESTDLEHELGKYVYQVELRDSSNIEYEVKIDAQTGEILQDKID